MIFWQVKSWENLTWNVTDLSISHVRCSHFTLGYPKMSLSSFNSIIHTQFWLSMLSQKKTSCSPLAHRTRKCHHTNLWTAKLFHLTGGLLHPFKCWRLWRQPVVGCRRRLWKEPVVMCGNWNVRQAMSQQVFTVTTYCINTCFQSFSTFISRSKPRCAEIQPNVATSRCRRPQHVHINCPRRSTRAMQITGSTKQQ